MKSVKKRVIAVVAAVMTTVTALGITPVTYAVPDATAINLSGLKCWNGTTLQKTSIGELANFDISDTAATADVAKGRVTLLSFDLAGLETSDADEIGKAEMDFNMGVSSSVLLFQIPQSKFSADANPMIDYYNKVSDDIPQGAPSLAYNLIPGIYDVYESMVSQGYSDTFANYINTTASSSDTYYNLRKSADLSKLMIKDTVINVSGQNATVSHDSLIKNYLHTAVTIDSWKTQKADVTAMVQKALDDGETQLCLFAYAPSSAGSYSLKNVGAKDGGVINVNVSYAEKRIPTSISITSDNNTNELTIPSDNSVTERIYTAQLLDQYNAPIDGDIVFDTENDCPNGIEKEAVGSNVIKLRSKTDVDPEEVNGKTIKLTATSEGIPSAEFNVTIKATVPVKYASVDLKNKTVYKYNIVNKSQHATVNDGQVTFTDTTRETLENPAFTDSDESTSYTSGQTANCAAAVDLGEEGMLLSKVVIKNVSASAIVGFASDDASSEIGTLSENSIVLNKNWARMNNGTPKNVADDVSITYGTNENGKYDTVTFTGNIGSPRYIVFDGNGSNSACGEIEVYVNKKEIPTTTEINGDGSFVISKTGVFTSKEYTATVYNQFGGKIENAELEWSTDGNTYVSVEDTTKGILTVSNSMPYGTSQLTIIAKCGDAEGKKTVTIEKKEPSLIKGITISGKAKINELTAKLPSDYSYTASVIDQYGAVMENEKVVWSVSGYSLNGVSINSATGVLTLTKDAQSTALQITAKSLTDNNVSSVFDVDVAISKYVDTVYPQADVLFRSGNSDLKNVNGPDVEIRNLTDDDRGFVGGIKFNISDIREAINGGQPINSVKLRLTTSISRNNKLIVKEFSDNWDESDGSANSYENKKDIIQQSFSSSKAVVENTADKDFMLNAKTAGKRIYEGDLGETETLSDWQTELDITDYLLGTGVDGDSNKNGFLADNPTAENVNFLIIPDYNGINSNTFFSKDISSENQNFSSDNWNLLVGKFPQLQTDISPLLPAIMIDYAQETVTVNSNVDTIPVPLGSNINSTTFIAEHYDPFTATTDNNVSWQIQHYIDKNGETISGIPTGVSISNEGVMSVSSAAENCIVTVRAFVSDNPAVYGQKEITVTELKTQLENGSFENITDYMTPFAWQPSDVDAESGYEGVAHYALDQASEPFLANIARDNDSDGYLSGAHNAEDPTGVYGKKTIMLKGLSGITKDYEGKVSSTNAANSANDGGPYTRVIPGMTYWMMQDYHLDDFYQLSTSALTGPHISYEGYQGTTSKKSQFSGNWYIKDGNATTPTTTKGYDTMTKQVTIPSNITRLYLRWALTGGMGSIYYHNFRLAPQGIDYSKQAADGDYELKVTDKMVWNSDPISVNSGMKYTYKYSTVTDSIGVGKFSVKFMDTDGNIVSQSEFTSKQSSQWEENSGEVTVPNNTAYAIVSLSNSAASGNVWFDNTIFTASSSPKASYIKIDEGQSSISVPNGAIGNRYEYTAVVTDQYNEPFTDDITWSFEQNYDGVSLKDGVVIVNSNAQAENIIINATAKSNSSVLTSKTIALVKEVQNAPAVELLNGDFAETENQYPIHWTNDNRNVSTENGTFDSSISGWKQNYTIYTVADSSAEMTWDSTVDHTGNSGGAAKIYNPDRAQGSMQINNNIDVAGGHAYEVSVWVKTNHVSDDSNVFASLLQIDENGSTLLEDKSALAFYPNDNDGYGNNTSDWTKLSTVVYLSDKTDKLRIDLRYRGGANNTNGTVWYDDLEIRKITAIDSQTTYNNDSTLKVTGYGEDVDVTRGYGEKWYSEPIYNITGGQQYIYSVYTKSINANKGSYVGITFYGSDGKQIQNTNSDKVTSSEWTQISGAVVAPADASYAVFNLYNDGDGISWFANASFETKQATIAKQLSIKGDDSMDFDASSIYHAVITDQYGIEIDTVNIPISATCPNGVTFDADSGKLSVSNNAALGEKVVLTAQYSGLTAVKSVDILDQVTSITIKGSTSVSHSTGSSATEKYSLLNQSGQSISADKATWSVTGTRVSIDKGILTISSSASAQKITITAQYNNCSAKLIVNITSSTTGGAGGGGGGGGGGGANSSGNSGSSLSGGSPAVGGNTIGNFTNGGANSDSSSDIGTGTAIIPQPDPYYFTQGLDNIGGFKDLGNYKWAQKAIVALSAVSVINGKSDGIFAPGDNITRAEFAKILMGTLEYAKLTDNLPSEVTFNDVTEDDWYYNAVSSAAKYGIVTGYDDNFYPNNLISRQDMAVMVSRACEAVDISLNNNETKAFTDNDSISDYAVSAVDKMSSARIINGYDDGSFMPFANATRAQAAVMIYRMAGGTE